MSAEDGPAGGGAGHDPWRLDGQVAVVTGASSGIGRAVALELARAGAAVVVAARASREGAEATRAGAEAAGGRAAVVLQDLADRASLVPFVERCEEPFGPAGVWVNNAGADILTGGRQHLGYEEKLDRLLAVDVAATVLLAREVGRRMRERGAGSITNIGWDQAETGMEGESGELFGAAKGAVMAFTRAAARSLAPEVRVNCIAPGWVRTAWGEQAPAAWQERARSETPLGRWGQPEDVARLARFLASPAAAWITGQVVRTNGGAVR